MSITTEHLERFVVDCQSNLDVIKTSLTAFNIFNVLGVQHREIRHSNFLGWLLDPQGSHRLGDIFLKSFLKQLRFKKIISADVFVQFLIEDLNQTIVHRETLHNIDILIENQELGLIICIENKIYSGYSGHQLEKYYKAVEDIFNQIPTKIFLTLTPSATSHHNNLPYGDQYSNIDYDDVVAAIEVNQESIDLAHSNVRESINQYIAMIKKDITGTSDEALLAQKIYRKYKKEIDFIVRNQHNFDNYRKEVIAYIENGKLSGFVMSHDPHINVIHLLPEDEELRKLFHFPEAKSWGGEYLFSLILFFEPKYVYLKFGFGNIIESNQKDGLVKEKSKLYGQMFDFEIFKDLLVKNSGLQMFDKNLLNAYTGIASIQLFDEEDFIASNTTFIDFFTAKFEEVNQLIIQPWIEECLSKLS